MCRNRRDTPRANDDFCALVAGIVPLFAADLPLLAVEREVEGAVGDIAGIVHRVRGDLRDGGASVIWMRSTLVTTGISPCSTASRWMSRKFSGSTVS
ncbi:hypothetical protein NJ76_10295 [Rhodococcus sp. IITR03]|nr:hypothetical protein NJ76_10295 [Rhodococcus sp. IITR03]